MVSNHFQGGDFWRAISRTPISKLRRITSSGWEGKAYFPFPNELAKYLKNNAKIILNRYEGDVRNVWRVEPSEVNCIYHRFLEFEGIGPALAKMAQFILVRDWGMAGGPRSKHLMRVKPDRHLCRVTSRTGLISSTTPSAVAKEIDALGLESQADFDLVVYRVGQNYCFPSSPNCDECPLSGVCAYAAA